MCLNSEQMLVVDGKISFFKILTTFPSIHARENIIKNEEMKLSVSFLTLIAPNCAVQISTTAVTIST